MSWITAATRILLLIALAALLGWWYGSTLAAVAVALACLVSFWIFQLRTVQLWLRDPRQAPPDVFGIWGDLVAQIYLYQRKNTEEQQKLQLTVDYLQDSFGSMRDGVVMVDGQGIIKWFNSAAERVLGLRYPDDIGQTLTNLVREPEFNAYFLGNDYDSPLQYSSLGESTRHIRLEITRFGTDARLLFVRDVSAAVRTEEIRRDLVGNISHELRTPLTVISGYLGTFLSDVDTFPAPYRKALGQMSQQAERMETLLRDLLWLSRIESEEQQSKLDRIDMCSLVEELRDEMVATGAPQPLELQLESDHKVQGDYRELYSAISNLVGNAVKYSADNSPVTISWRRLDDGYHLAVKDAGVGIDALHLPRLTERFYRVDDSRNSATGGTGLGLAIVKHIAAAHGARLEIESTLGEGSSFSLVFPLGG